MSISMRRLPKFLHKRSFLLRLFITTLLASFIPLSIISTQLVKNQIKNFEESATMRLDSATYYVGVQFDKMISNLDNIAIKLMLSKNLNEAIIDKSLQNELTALETLSYYSEALPYVSTTILYFPEKCTAYTSSGKLYKNGLVNQLFGISIEQFDSFLTNCHTASFAPFDLTRHILYIVPLRSNIYSRSTQYAIFMFSPNMFDYTMESFLNENYSLMSIEYNNLVVYHDTNRYLSSLENSEDYLISSSLSSKLYRIWISGDKSAIYGDFDQVVSHTQELALLNVLLCIVLIGMVVVYNYKPLSSLLRFLSQKNTAANDTVPEIESITRSFSSLISENFSLEKQLEQKNIQLTDRMLEKLLIGKKVSDDNIESFMPDCNHYYVICCQLDMLPNVSKIIEEHYMDPNIYILEMFDDNRLVIVIGYEYHDHPTCREIAVTAREIVDNGSIVLGYSHVCNKVDDLFKAYMEAEHALLANDTCVDHFINSTMSDSFYLQIDDSKSIKELASAIKTGSDFIVNYAKDILSDIFLNSNSNAAIVYNCFQLLELYRRAIIEAKFEVNLDDLSRVISSNNASIIRTRIISFVESVQEKSQATLAQSNSVSYTQLVDYIEEHYRDPMFGMVDIADFMGVSIYVASRLLKKATNVNFRKYINVKRVEYAKSLLIDSEYTIAEIALMSGFSSATYFNKVFRENTGIAPNLYRSNTIPAK